MPRAGFRQKPVEAPPSARRARHDGGRVPRPRTRVVLPDHAPPRIKPGVSSPRSLYHRRTVRAARERVIDHSTRASRKPGEMSGGRLDARTLKDEVASMDKGWLLDLGHPLLNRVADSFIRAAGVGAARAVAREAYFVTVEGLGGDTAGLDNGGKRSHFSSFRGDDGQKSLDAVVKSAGKEAFQWGLAAGVYSGLTYGLREARGCHDWKNSAIAGAIAGAAVALTGDTGHADHIVHFAITGAALSSAASLLSAIF